MSDFVKYFLYFLLGGTIVSVSTYLGSQGKSFLAASFYRVAVPLKCHVDQRTGMGLGIRIWAVNDMPMKPLPISMHYDSEDGFETLRGVTECGKDEFLVITGDKTHYLLPKPSVPNCPFHDWLRANVAGCASNPGPVIGRSVEPRSFFVSSEPHHCAHRDVNLAKASPITAANKDRCGPRSGQEGRSFCEIWCFEQHLCCRTCTFEEVCTKAAVFRLPCSRPEA